jgi:hypothetical protein
VGEQRPAVGQDARHRGALVRPGREAGGETGEAEVAAVVLGQDRGAEQRVVGGGKPVGTVGVLPHPGGEPGGERFLLVAGGERLGVVADAAAVVGGVGDRVEPLVQGGVEQRHGVGAAGAPLGG